MAETFHLPSARVVLGHLITAFNLRPFDSSGALTSRTAERYFAGDLIGVDEQKNILRAAVRALLKSGIMPRLPRLEDDLGAELVNVLKGGQNESPAVTLLASYVESWDAIVASLRSSSPRVSSRRMVHCATLQMIVVDLAVRLTGLLGFRKAPEGQALPSYWFRRRGIPDWLRALKQDAQLTGEGLAKRAGVDPNTVDGWLDGARPTDENLQDLASALRETETQRSDLLRAFRVAYGMNAVFEQIQGIVGLEAAMASAERLSTYPIAMLAAVRPARLGVTDMWTALLFGTRSKRRWISHALEQTSKTEPDPVWRTTLRAVQGGWLERLLAVTRLLDPRLDDEAAQYLGVAAPPELQEMMQHQLLSSPQELARDPLVALSIHSQSQHGLPARMAPALRAMVAHQDGDSPRAIGLLRCAIQLEPGDAKLHFRLAGLLWESGERDAALGELEVAAQLEPGWDQPHLHLAIILGNEQRHEEALDRLERCSTLLRERTPQFLSCLAHCYERLGRIGSAINAYEELLAADPQHAKAMDRLAHLNLISGHKREGARWARQAAKCGVTAVFTAWKARRYAKASRKRTRRE